jgi:hypothetical protein
LLFFTAKIGAGAMDVTSTDIDVTFSDVFPIQVSKVLLAGITQGVHLGKFHSKFKNCVNGIFDNRSFFNICSDKVWINPRSIQITDEAWHTSRMSHINPGDRCGLVGHVLYIPILSIRMDLKKALQWDGRLAWCPEGVSIDRIVRNLETMKLLHQSKEDSFIYPRCFKETLKERILCLKDAVTTGPESLIEKAITSLVGFGPGLTPTGDDFLTGVMAILHMMEKMGYPHRAGNRILNYIARSCLDKTTIFSEQMLLDGASGHFAFPIAKLVKDLMTQDNEERLKSSVNDLLSAGASSGYDVLRGMLWAMDVFMASLFRRG